MVKIQLLGFKENKKVQGIIIIDFDKYSNPEY